jgi:hypothetical protein
MLELLNNVVIGYAAMPLGQPYVDIFIVENDNLRDLSGLKRT